MPLDPKQQPPYYTIDENLPPINGEPKTILQINQTGTANPTYTIIQNNLAEITSLTRSGIGVYVLTYAENQIDANTSILITNVGNNANIGLITAVKTSATQITIRTTDLAATISDNILVDTYLQITQS